MNLKDMDHHQQRDFAVALGKQIIDLMNEQVGEKDQYLLKRTVIGEVLKGFFYSPSDLSENNIGWAVDHAVAQQLGGQIPRLLALHKYLIENNCAPGTEWDLNHCDRYAASLANEPGFKVIAAQTQNYTYFVVLCKKTRFVDDSSGQIKAVDDWQVHIRQCTSARYSRDVMRKSLTDLEFLKTPDKAFESDYLRYADMRDRGYIVSVSPQLTGSGYEAERVMIDYCRLTHIVYDLASLIDSMESGNE